MIDSLTLFLRRKRRVLLLAAVLLLPLLSQGCIWVRDGRGWRHHRRCAAVEVVADGLCWVASSRR
jgi:hypothetical protein